MPDTTLTSADLIRERADWLVDAVAMATQNRALLRGDDAEDTVLTEALYLNAIKAMETLLARAGLEAGKAEESMRERAATVADDMRNKFGSRTGDAYSNGLWDQGVRIANTIRALPLTTEGGKP